VLFPGENTFCQPSTNVFSRLTEDQREEPEDEQEDGIVLVDGQLAARERRTIRMASLSEADQNRGYGICRCRLAEETDGKSCCSPARTRSVNRPRMCSRD
jgi:hypothetical protein